MAGFNDWVTIEGKLDESIVCSMDFSAVQLLSKKEAIDHTVNVICRLGKDIFVSMSGGMDSEFVAKALKDRGVKFYPVIVDYQTNAAEVWYAYYWCKKNGIEPTVINLTTDMVRASFPSLARKYGVPYVGAINFIVEHFAHSKGGIVVAGSWDPFQTFSCDYDKSNAATDPYLQLEAYELDTAIAFPNRHPLGFIFHTPELLYSMVSELDYTKPPQISKAEFYGVEPRPKHGANHNVMKSKLLHDEFTAVNRSTKFMLLGLGYKDDVLDVIRSKGKINCLAFPKRFN